jgi:hypothetical protein
MGLLINISVGLLFFMYLYTFAIAKKLDAQQQEFDDIIDSDFLDY